AGAELANLDLLFDAFRGFLERDLDVVTEVRAALAPVRSLLAAEEMVEDSSRATTAAEDLAEEVERIVESAAATAAESALAERRVSVAIVGRALVGIHQHVVGLTELLETLLRLAVTRVFVRMILHRELAVGALDFLRRG